ncbi:hypothetical protein ACFQ0M_05120 [Kitasatospora aburaviensis]
MAPTQARDVLLQGLQSGGAGPCRILLDIVLVADDEQTGVAGGVAVEEEE